MNLIKLALAAEQFAKAQPPVVADAQRCLHAKDKAATCERCVQACPVEAIHLENKLHVDTDKCIRCGLCLHLCPVGAFEGQDAAYRLLYCASQLPEPQTVELACSLHPNAEQGNSEVDAVLRAAGCLAAFGPSVYVGLSALGIGSIRVRLDACMQCPIGRLKPEIEAAVTAANSLLAAVDRPEAVTMVCDQEKSRRISRREVYSVKNPPVSRRAFFQKLAHKPVKQVADIATPNASQIEGDKSSPRERRRLINALSLLAPVETGKAIASDHFTQFTVTEDCTACELCARVCPTGALEMRVSEGGTEDSVGNRFEINFAASACTNCGLCLKFCANGALQRAGMPALADLLSNEKVVLHTGILRQCRKCKALFSGKSDQELCPLCDFRRKTPFGNGSMLKQTRQA